MSELPAMVRVICVYIFTLKINGKNIQMKLKMEDEYDVRGEEKCYNLDFVFVNFIGRE